MPFYVNKQRVYVTSHKVPNLSESILQDKKSDNLDGSFKEIAYYPLVIVRSDVEKNVNHYCDLGKMQAEFEFHRSFPHEIDDEIDDDKNAVIAFNISMPVFILRVDRYSIMAIDFSCTTLNPAQILMLTMNVHTITFSISGDWISQEQSHLSANQNNWLVLLTKL